MQKNVSAIAASIYERLHDLTKDEIERSSVNNTLNVIKSANKLKNNFQIHVDSSDLKRPSCKKTITRNVLNQIHFQTDPDECFRSCDKLATALSLPRDEILVKFCEKITGFPVILKAAQLVSRFDDASAKNLCSFVVLLLKYLATCKLQFDANESFEDGDHLFLSDMESVDDNLFHPGLKLSVDLISKAMLKAEGQELALCVEVFHWANLGFYLTNNQDLCMLHKQLFGDFGFCGALLPGFITYAAINVAFNTTRRFLSKYQVTSSKLRAHI